MIYSLAPDLHPWDQLGDYFSLTIHLTTRTQVKSQPLGMHRVLCTMQTPLISLFPPHTWSQGTVEKLLNTCVYIQRAEPKDIRQKHTAAAVAPWH